MTDLSSIRLFSTHPHKCSYLDDREATTLFVDPQIEVDKNLYSRLSEYGFRRSGNHLYRPHCANCVACIPARVPVHCFEPNRRQRRCVKRNQDLTAEVIESIDTTECYLLYEKYINQRHTDGDMYPPSREQFRTFLSREWGVTEFLGFRNTENKLVGIAVCDVMDNGLSAIYTFFDPDEHVRSLGTYAVLHQIDEAKRTGLKFVYLGYWIKACKKMSYKSQYRPLEFLVEKKWVRIS